MAGRWTVAGSWSGRCFVRSSLKSSDYLNVACEKRGFGNLFAEVNSGHTSSTTKDVDQFAVGIRRGVESIQPYVFCRVSSAAFRAAAKTAG